MKITEGLCIKFLGENYFFTNKTDRRYGVLYYYFCKMKPQNEITPFDFWGVSERYFNEQLEKGAITIIEKFADL